MRFPWAVLFLSFTVWLQPVQASVESDFRAARESFHKRQFERFDRFAARIPADHPLQSYIDYWRLKAHNATPDDLAGYIARYPESPLADRLRAELAGLYALAENWPAFRAQFRALYRPTQELVCYDVHLRLREGDRGAAGEGRELWLTGKNLPESCTPLFDALFQLGQLTPEDRYKRLRLALDVGNMGLARALDAALPEAERLEANALAMAQRHGDELIQAGSARRAQREAALYALGLFARLDPPGAARLWEAHGDRYTVEERAYGWGQIAMQAARKHDPRALEWFARVDADHLSSHSELQILWRARAALRAGKWLELYQAIQAMPQELQEESVWRYWKARALKALNAVFPANLLFAKLSQELDYYGLLALEEMPPRVEARPSLYRVTPDDLAAAEANPALRLALLLRKLDLPANAQDEWNRALRGMSDRQLLAAAELALREGWHDRAIFAASQTKSEHNFDLRFIAPYRDLASAYARENGLDEAWVFGLIRQESRFMSYARSQVGAQGLMQVMPATAKWIAAQMGLDRRAHQKVGNPDTNIRFGTYYLKRIYDSLAQSPVLATAAYNAGPGRARRWQAETPLEGAVYVETIPFQETRDYVKKVMTNAMFYRTRFGGEAVRLKDRLGVIPARAGQAVADADETAPAPE
ncbi:MAG: transglycosylase SLT domain-containing protein [Pseudomonadota bacterium]